MIGQGVSSRSSHSEAAGRTTFSAKPCTHSRMSFWSWVSSREKLGPPPSAALSSARRSSVVLMAPRISLARKSGADTAPAHVHHALHDLLAGLLRMVEPPRRERLAGADEPRREGVRVVLVEAAGEQQRHAADDLRPHARKGL